MLNPWGKEAKLKAVVLCAGRGSRMNPETMDKPKVMVDINGRPAIHYVINYWKKYTDDFVFIVGYKKEMIMDYVSGEPIRSIFIEQVERKGIAHAMLHAEKVVSDQFIVVLGDCICKGDFSFPTEMSQGIGVCQTDNVQAIRQSYSVEFNDVLISRVVEKPEVLINDFCGMGFYFFRKRVFDYIKKTAPSSLRNEVEITDVIQKMIEAGEAVSPVWFNGDYINVTFPEDIEKVKRLFFEVAV